MRDADRLQRLMYDLNSSRGLSEEEKEEVEDYQAQQEPLYGPDYVNPNEPKQVDPNELTPEEEDDQAMALQSLGQQLDQQAGDLSRDTGIPQGDTTGSSYGDTIAREPAATEEAIQEAATQAAPKPVAPKSPYQQLMDEYEAAKEAHQNKALGVGVANAFAQYGVDRAAARAQIAGGAPMKARQLKLSGLGQGPQLDDYVKKVKMMETLSELKGGSGGSDPNSPESQIARQIGANLLGRPLHSKMTADQINKILPSLARKAESSYQTKRYDLSKDRLGFQKEKEEQRESEAQREWLFKNKKYSDTVGFMDSKQQQEYSGIVRQEMAYKKIKELAEAVSTNKAKYFKEAVKSWIPNANHEEEFIKFRSMSGAEMFNYIKAISGAQFSDAERERFESILPTAKDNPKELKGKFAAWEEGIRTGKKTFEARLRMSPQREVLKKDIWNLNFKESQRLNEGEVVRVTKDGRNAIFDAATKKFLRYE